MKSCPHKSQRIPSPQSPRISSPLPTWQQVSNLLNGQDEILSPQESENLLPHTSQRISSPLPTWQQVSNLLNRQDEILSPQESENPIPTRVRESHLHKSPRISSPTQARESHPTHITKSCLRLRHNHLCRGRHSVTSGRPGDRAPREAGSPAGSWPGCGGDAPTPRPALLPSARRHRPSTPPA